MAKIAPFGRYRAFDANVDPLAGGKLYTYEAGTSTPKATYTDKDAGTANTNPVIMDSQGYADVWLDVGGYKFVLTDENDVTQWTADDIDGGGSEGYGSSVISRSSGFTLSTLEQNNAIVCTQALTVSLLSAAVAGDGFVAVLINTSTGNVTVDPDGSELIDGASTLIIPSMSSVTLFCNGSAWYTSGYTRSVTTDVYRVRDSSDTSKALAFNLSGLTTATTRTLTAQDKSGIIPVIETANLSIPATSSGPSSLSLAEDTDNGTNKVTVISPSTLGSDVTFTLPTASGVPALTSKFAITVYTSGSGNWTSPADITSETVFKVTGTGAGGGGGYGNTVGNGGGAGATFIKYVTGLAASTNYAYAVGASGAGGTSGAQTGTTGGSTTFTNGVTTYTAAGGAGGIFNGGFGGLGGTATNGDVNINGGAGDSSTNATNPAGQGGASFWGSGGGGGDGAAGRAGLAYGSGGGGGANSNNGGAGASGALILERLG